MKLAFCGNDCEECPRYCATMSKDSAELERVRLLWIQAGWRDESVDLEELLCTGCTGASFCRYGVAACASAREIAHCGQCPDYPCQRITSMFAQSQAHERQCTICITGEEYQQLQRAFFNKRQNLEDDRVLEHT